LDEHKKLSELEYIRTPSTRASQKSDKPKIKKASHCVKEIMYRKRVRRWKEPVDKSEPQKERRPIKPASQRRGIFQQDEASQATEENSG